MACNDDAFAATSEKYLVAGSWVIIFISIPDIVLIAKGGTLNHLPFGLDFLSPFGLSPYSANRLRGFTQEPSYLGMVIATIYPICFMRLNEKFSFSRVALVLGLWVCLAYSVSRTGLLSCFLLSFLILFGWPKRLLLLLIVLLVLGGLWWFFPQLHANNFWNLSWVPLFNQANIDGSTLVRSAHIIASLKAWYANPVFGVGLGQLGFVLPQFYPSWYGPAAPEYQIWAPKAAFGGVPSLAFLPKLLAEIGLFGIAILGVWLIPVLKKVINSLKNNSLVRKYLLAFLGFLIASFGVEGYLFLPAWLILGVALGLIRKSAADNEKQERLGQEN